MPIIAIVGTDGCGKTTQSRMLVERLRKQGYDARYIQPVYALFHILPARIRPRLRGGLASSPRRTRTTKVNSLPKRIMKSIKSLMMGISGYPYALLNYVMLLILSSRQAGVAVCDRYFYQYFFDLYGDRGEKIARGLPRPDITYWLHGDLEVFYARMESPFDSAVSEDYYAAVNNLYQKLARKYGFVQLDANLDKDSISETIFAHLLESLKNQRVYTGAGCA